MTQFCPSSGVDFSNRGLVSGDASSRRPGSNLRKSPGASIGRRLRSRHFCVSWVSPPTTSAPLTLMSLSPWLKIAPPPLALSVPKLLLTMSECASAAWRLATQRALHRVLIGVRLPLTSVPFLKMSLSP